MLKTFFLTVAMALFLLRAAAQSDAAEQRTTVKLEDVPVAVKETIQQHVGKGKLQEIEKVVDDDEVAYDVQMRKNNRERSFTVGEDGALTEVEMFLGETPPRVREGIKKRVVNGQIDNISKIFDGGDVSFEVEYTTEGKSRTFTLDNKGQLAELQLFLPETPAPVQKAILKDGAGWNLEEITEVFEDGQPSYQVELVSGDNTRIITFDAQGGIESREESIASTQLPEPVLKTVREIVKDGRAGKIIRTVEGDETSYDIHVHRADKWEIVTVSSDGKAAE